MSVIKDLHSGNSAPFAKLMAGAMREIGSEHAGNTNLRKSGSLPNVALHTEEISRTLSATCEIDNRMDSSVNVNSQSKCSNVNEAWQPSAVNRGGKQTNSGDYAQLTTCKANQFDFNTVVGHDKGRLDHTTSKGI